MRRQWYVLWKLTWRYFLPPRKSGRRSGVLLAIGGVAVGVLAIVSVMAVMNGLQQGYIRTILEVESGHIQVQSHGFWHDDQELQLSNLLKRYGVRTVTPRIKQTTMIRSLWGHYSAFQIFGLPVSTVLDDPLFLAKLNITVGNFPDYGEILLGVELASKLSADVGSLVTILVMPEGSQEPYELTLEVSGLFMSNYYSYDANLAIMDLNFMIDLLGSDRSLYYTLKLDTMTQTNTLVKQLNDKGYEARSWEIYNRAFFGALKLEKQLMMIMLQLIFIVTAINIYQGRRRMILQKELEATILRTLGISQKSLHLAFVFQGTLIGLVGTIIGIIFGLLLAYNINSVIFYTTLLVNYVLMIFNMHIYMLFDSSFFYLQSIPVEVIPSDIIYVSVSAIMITTFSSWIAGRASFKTRPLEIL